MKNNNLEQIVRSTINTACSVGFESYRDEPENEYADKITLGGRTFICKGKIASGGTASVYLYIDSENRLYACKRIEVTKQKESQLPYYRSELKMQIDLAKKGFSTMPVLCCTPLDEIDTHNFEKGSLTINILMPYGVDAFSYFSKKSKLSTPFSEMEQLCFSYSLFKALSELHSNNWLHKDIKPANIFLVRSNSSSRNIRILLGDFTISKMLSEQNVATMFNGTETYAPPEYFLFRNRVIREMTKEEYLKWDVYSAGLTLLALFRCGGQLPAEYSRPSNRIDPNLKPDLEYFKSKTMKTVLENSLMFKFNDRISAADAADILKNRILEIGS